VTHLVVIYGSFFLAIASILYSFFCPTEIKNYDSAYEMSDHQSEHDVRLKRFEEIKYTVQSYFASLTELERSLAVAEPDYKPLGIPGGQLEKISELLLYQWGVKNITSPRLRIFIFLLFWTGLSVIAIPAIFTFAQVTGLLVTRVLS
jgi:hypothetical protein